MRSRPEHADEIGELIERCERIEDGLGDLPTPRCSVLRTMTDDLVVHLRVSWVVERPHRAKLADGDDRLQNAADIVVAHDELARRFRAKRRHSSTPGGGPEL